MCPPDALPALVGPRSWVEGAAPLDREKARAQWQRLATLVEDHVAPVAVVTAEPWAFAMTFIRDLGLSTARGLIPLSPAGVREPFERPLFSKALAELGVAELSSPENFRLPGGNVVADTHNRLLIGTSGEESGQLRAATEFLAATTGRDAYRVPLAGGRFPHLDMALCDLDGRGWLVYPGALPGFDLSRTAWRDLFLDLPVIIAEPDDGEVLACNLLVGDRVAIGPEISGRLRGEIDRLGVEYVPTPLNEILKAGGGAHCLTLDVS